MPLRRRRIIPGLLLLCSLSCQPADSTFTRMSTARGPTPGRSGACGPYALSLASDAAGQPVDFHTINRAILQANHRDGTRWRQVLGWVTPSAYNITWPWEIQPAAAACGLRAQSKSGSSDQLWAWAKGVRLGDGQAGLLLLRHPWSPAASHYAAVPLDPSTARRDWIVVRCWTVERRLPTP